MVVQLDTTQGEEVGQVENLASQDSDENVNLVSGFALQASAKQDLTMSDSMAVGAAAGRDMAVSDSLMLYGAVGRDLGYKDSAAITLVAGNTARLDQSGTIIAVSKEVNVRSGFLGIVLSQKTNLSDNSKVLLDTKQAAIFGAAFGAVFALFGWLLRKK